MTYTKRMAAAALLLVASTAMAQATQQPTSSKPAATAHKDTTHMATMGPAANAKRKTAMKKMHKDSAKTKKP